MATTCPCCGMRSSAEAESCRLCGHALYRLSYTAQGTASPRRRATRITPMSARLALGGAAVVVGAGALAGIVTGSGDDEEPVSGEKVPATSLPRESTEEPEPTTSPEQSETKTPPAPAPATTPPAGATPTEPTPTGSPSASTPGEPGAEWVIGRPPEGFGEGYGPKPGRTYWEWHGQDGNGFHYRYHYERSGQR